MDYQRYPIMMTRGKETVTVGDAATEEEKQRQGFTAAGGDPMGYLATSRAVPDSYRPVEYPKWVGEELVNNREEEIALLAILTGQPSAVPSEEPTRPRRGRPPREAVGQ